MRKFLTKYFICFLAFPAFCLTLCSVPASDKKDVLVESSKLASDERLDWFKEAKFGMFIHWGLYAVPAGEWEGRKDYGEWIMLKADIPPKEYEKFAAGFNPVKFDAKEWVGIAKKAGMKYLVITAKHHDGFSMYDSKYTEYDIMDATPYKRDPLKELSQACQDAGIKFCVYYSLPDWHHPDFPSKYNQIRKEYPDGYPGNSSPNADLDKYAAFMKNQLTELLTNYGPISILWFDGGGSFRNYDRKALLKGEEIVKLIHDLQPNCLINNRLGFGEDYGTPEQKIPGGQLSEPFEVCMTLNTNWGYNKNDNNWKSAETVIRNIADIASKGGNYLLNVGPDASGTIPQASQDILSKVGDWMKVNGESIYGSQAGPAHDKIRMGNGVMTRKPGTMYLHITKWPSNQTIFMEGVKGKEIEKIYLLADPNKNGLTFTPHERSLFIDVPKNAPDEYNSVIVLEYKNPTEL